MNTAAAHRQAVSAAGAISVRVKRGTFAFKIVNTAWVQNILRAAVPHGNHKIEDEPLKELRRHLGNSSIKSVFSAIESSSEARSLFSCGVRS
jgi:hypothetical protein